MVVIIRKRLLIILGAVLAFFALAAGTTAAVSAAYPKQEIVVVLDAGHGGIDAGVIGVNSRVKESDINLLITLQVKDILETQNFKVILTRKNEDGLYGNVKEGFKSADMRARKETILAAKPTLVVSIHCNKFPDRTRRGAQVFFEASSEKGIALARCMQTSMNIINAATAGREFPPLKGDYYMLNCSKYPSVIVECGFLSNPEDDRLLNTPAHRTAVSESIARGIVSYLVNIE